MERDFLPDRYRHQPVIATRAAALCPIGTTFSKPAVLSPAFVLVAFDQAGVAHGFSNDGRRIQILRSNSAIGLGTEKLRTPRGKLQGNQMEKLIRNRHRPRTPRFRCCLVVAAPDPHQSALEIEVLPLESAHLAFSQPAVDGDRTKQSVRPRDGSKDSWNNLGFEKPNVLRLNLRFGHGGGRILATVKPHSSSPIEDRDEGFPEMKYAPFTKVFRFRSQKATDEPRSNLLEEEIAKRRQ